MQIRNKKEEDKFMFFKSQEALTQGLYLQVPHFPSSSLAGILWGVFFAQKGTKESLHTFFNNYWSEANNQISMEVAQHPQNENRNPKNESSEMGISKRCSVDSSSVKSTKTS